MEKKKKRKLDMTPPQHNILGERSTKRSQKLIAHIKAIIDDMVEKGIPFTVERVSLKGYLITLNPLLIQLTFINTLYLSLFHFIQECFAPARHFLFASIHKISHRHITHL